MYQILFLSKRNAIFRTDVFLLITIYGIILPIIYTLEPIPEIYTKFIFVLLFFFNCLFLFICETSHKYKAKHCFWQVAKIEQASHVNIIERLKSGTTVYKVIPLELIQTSIGPATIFYHNKLKFYYDKSEKKFRKIKPFLHQTCSRFTEPGFQPFHSKFEANLMDKNQLKFPLPNFLQIFKEHIMDPLNFFQIFSVMLWFFDNDIFHPLMVLIMLLISNSVVCFQRISTILNLRSLQTKPYQVQVWNEENKTFDKRSSEDLQPGDIVVVQRTKELTCIDSEKVAGEDLDEIRKMVPFGDQIPETIIMKFLQKNNPLENITQKNNDEKSNESTKVFNSIDLLILEGSVAVDESLLTGESLPQIKDPIDKKYHQEVFSKNKFKNSVVYAGTDVLQTTAEPNKKVLGLVLNTGFYTTKGKLARMMLFNEENNATTQKDAYILLFLLLIVSLCSSLYVLFSNIDDENRNKDKLFIRCILIVTNVVPPELPMIMSMAVNASVMFLRGKKIFCTEPFRIPLAGKIDTCVFDKTGTITQESLKLKGFVFYEKSSDSTVFENSLKCEKNPGFEKMCAILAGCHNLIEVNKVLTGDPIEALFFKDSDYRFSAGCKQATYIKNTNKTVTIKRVYSFNSELKRMSTIVRISGHDTLSSGDYIVTKGAPEVMSNLIQSKSSFYDEWISELAAEGFRLLALGLRKLNEGEIMCDDRDKLEGDLDFVGFLVLSNDLKHDSKEYIQRLREAERNIVILTGDHLLTSLKTFESLFSDKTEDSSKMSSELLNQKLNQVKINKKEHKNEISAKWKYAIVSYKDGIRIIKNEFNETIKENPSEEFMNQLTDKTIGINGNEIDFCLAKDKNFLKYLQVVGRVSPKQKEAFIVELQKTRHVLMCGDGSNDVGALKSAHIGIALVGMNNEPTKQEKLERKKKKEEIMKKAMSERRLPKAEDLLATEGEIDFKLGDASIAAPFTNKHSNSLKCVETILKQGVCTLTCGMQSYKIVTLSSFLTAYSLSKLHMENLKFSDMQNTLMGIYGAYLYYQLSNGKPVKRLSKDRPPNSIFNKFFWSSLFGQLLIQFTFTYLIGQFSKSYKPPAESDIDNEDEFIPTFTNSVMFVFDLASMFCISVFNYEGRPYMLNLSENKKHFKFLMIPIFLLAILIFELSEDISALFQMTLVSPFKDVQQNLFLIVFGFIGCTFAWTVFIKRLQHGKVEKYI